MQVLKTAQAKGMEERSVVAKRLLAGSKGWGDKILERKQRLVLFFVWLLFPVFFWRVAKPRRVITRLD